MNPNTGISFQIHVFGYVHTLRKQIEKMLGGRQGRQAISTACRQATQRANELVDQIMQHVMQCTQASGHYLKLIPSLGLEHSCCRADQVPFGSIFVLSGALLAS